MERATQAAYPRKAFKPVWPIDAAYDPAQVEEYFWKRGARHSFDRSEWRACALMMRATDPSAPELLVTPASRKAAIKRSRFAG